VEHTGGAGERPVNAMDNALRKALEKFYPGGLGSEAARLQGSRHPAERDGSRTVLIQSGQRKPAGAPWASRTTSIEASWQALVDSFRYKLWRTRVESPGSPGSSGGKGRDISSFP